MLNVREGLLRRGLGILFLCYGCGLESVWGVGGWGGLFRVFFLWFCNDVILFFLECFRIFYYNFFWKIIFIYVFRTFILVSYVIFILICYISIIWIFLIKGIGLISYIRMVRLFMFYVRYVLNLWNKLFIKVYGLILNV